MRINKKLTLFSLFVISIIAFLFFYESIFPPGFRCYIQPFENVEILTNTNNLQYKVISSDKTLGLIEIQFDEDDLKTKPTLTLINKGYDSIIYNTERYHKENLPVFIFDKEDQTHHFSNYIKTGKQPKSVTFLDSLHVSVPLLHDNGINIINIATGEVKRVQPPYKWARKKGFVETLVIEERREFWVSQMFANAIHVFDLDTYDFKQTITINGKWPKTLEFDPFRNCVYTGNWRSKDISVIDLKSKKDIYSFKLDQIPRGLSLTPDGNFLYVCQFSDSDMLKIDLNKNEPVNRFGEVGSKRHVVITKDGKRLYVSDLGAMKIEVYNTKNDSFIKKIKVFDKPNTIVLSHDENYLYVSCRGPNNPTLGYTKKGLEMGRIYLINTKTLTVEDFWEGGNQPTGLDISPDGKHIVLSDFLDDVLRVYKTN